MLFQHRMHPQNLGTFLTQSDGIAALMPQAKRLLDLRGILAALLPEPLAQSCSIANYKQGKIVIFAANSAIAAKLKLLRPTLCEQLLKRGVEVTGMEVQVQPPQSANEVIEKSAQLGTAAAESLDRLSAQLPDSELKTAIRRLARRGRD